MYRVQYKQKLSDKSRDGIDKELKTKRLVGFNQEFIPWNERLFGKVVKS